MKKAIIAVAAFAVLAAASPEQARGFHGRGRHSHFHGHRPPPRQVYVVQRSRSDAWFPVMILGTAIAVGAIASMR